MGFPGLQPRLGGILNGAALGIVVINPLGISFALNVIRERQGLTNFLSSKRNHNCNYQTE